MESQASLFSLPGVLSFVKVQDPGVPPILDLVPSLTLRKIFYRKHHCNCSWCPYCFKRTSFKKIQGRISGMDWERTRHIVLTVERGEYKDGREAYERVKKDEAVSQLIWNLKRVKGVEIEKWLWVLEWHRDGFPHWHLLVQTRNRGMIGGDLLRQYWAHGLWVKETYFRSRSHWNAIVGYFSRKGYFEAGKKYQSELPQWAKYSGLKIRRFSGSVESVNNVKGVSWVEKNKEGELRGFKVEGEEQDTYAVRIGSCGAFTSVSIDSPWLGVGYLIDIPFKEFKKFVGGSYEVGMGYLVLMNEREVDVLIGLCEKHQKIKGQKGEKEGGE